MKNIQFYALCAKLNAANNANLSQALALANHVSAYSKRASVPSASADATSCEWSDTPSALDVAMQCDAVRESQAHCALD